MPGRACAVVALLTYCAVAFSQDAKVRVFISDSSSWELSGGFGSGLDAAAGGASGGARPQTAEIMRTFAQRCPSMTITLRKEAADYVVLLDHEGGKEPVRRDNKIAVFDRSGDMIFSGSTRMLGNAVKDACAAIRQDRTAPAGSARGTGGI